MKLDVVSFDKGKGGSIDLAEEVFGLTPRGDILHRCVTWQLAKRQQGTHKSKPRNEVRMTSKKMYKQKGTGGARHGNKAAPQFRGGGTAHGPRPRSHAVDLPKKVRRLALKHALSAKQAANELIIVDALALDAAKTKALVERFATLGIANALIVDSEVNDNFGRAARNIPNVDVLPAVGANVYDILRREKLVLTKAAVESLEARLK
ncbi:MAG: 50S ribosomal protein L4 [Parvularculaceae bacterium]|nr:50S ribosomal protein L4 [Parvularculaceae bacterium]